MQDLLNKYKDHFKDIPSLYDYQEEVLKMMSNAKNTLAIIPTGGGKSLLYQLMALELDGLTIVVSPLIALMAEQVTELNQVRDIKALALNSTLNLIDQRKILRNLKEYQFKILYVSPERLQNTFFRAGLIASDIKISMIVVDEAHCISQWGSSFRPDYGQIKEFHTFLKGNEHNPFFLCLTATLAIPAREDIKKEFEIEDTQVYISKSIIRENLVLHFQKVDKEVEKEDLFRAFLKKKNPAKTIAYLYSTYKCELFAEIFADEYNTDYFHADVDTEEKQNVYDKFVNNEIDLLFATTAFGMGINIPDIECVAHLQIPNSIEEYYQQVGRGWRRKDLVKKCNCIVLWSNKNFDERLRELNNQKYNVEDVYDAYKKLIGSSKIRKIGQVVNKSKDSLLNSNAYNLQLLRYKLEKRGIIRTIGELNGTPTTVKLYKNTPFWNEIIKTAEGMDSFSYVSKILNVPLQKIIQHLYKQDLAGNIEKLPATKKDIYFEILKLELESEVAEVITQEINQEVDFRIQQLNELRDLFSSSDHSAILSDVLS